ncbi:hypothetical protein JOD47_002012 [Arthrobacter tumbae]|nr:hypothetical protein [Arthrobacter tumbae]
MTTIEVVKAEDLPLSEVLELYGEWNGWPTRRTQTI